MVAPTTDRTPSLSRDMSLARLFSAVHQSAHQTPRPSSHGRRQTIETVAPPPSLNRSSRAVVTSALQVDGLSMPALPFAARTKRRQSSSPDARNLREEETRERRSATKNKFRRRHSPIAAAVAERRRHSMEAMISEQRESKVPAMGEPVVDAQVRSRRRGGYVSSVESWTEMSEQLHQGRKCSAPDEKPVEPMPQQQQQQQQQHHNGFCIDYSLGETLRSPSHTLQGIDSREAMVAIDMLNKHDFAFVRRSDGSFSYAIMAFRSFEPSKVSAKDGDEERPSVEECMTFVMCGSGSTKMVRRHHWPEFIRMVSPQRDPRPVTPPVVEPAVPLRQKVAVPSPSRPVLCRKSEASVDDEELGYWVPPTMISFHRAAAAPSNDECSVISSVSDRARQLRVRG